MQRLQDPNQIDIDNLNSVRREASRHFRKKEKEYLKPQIGELETNSNIKSTRDFYRGIHDFKKGCQPRTNTVKDEKGDLVTDSSNILAGWRNHFSHLFSVHGVSDLRQTEVRTV